MVFNIYSLTSAFDADSNLAVYNIVFCFTFLYVNEHQHKSPKNKKFAVIGIKPITPKWNAASKPFFHAFP